MSALAEREEELAALIAEQDADAQYGDRINYKRERSLDAPLGHDSDAGSLAEIVGTEDKELHLLIGGEATAVRRISRPQKWTRRGIVKHIRAWVKEHGEIPKYADWNRPNGRGIPSSASLARKFGSFDAAILAAGFEPRGVGGAAKQDQTIPQKRRERIRTQKKTARLTSDDLAAAYILYDRQKLSLKRLGELLYQRYDYPSARLCEQAVAFGFAAEGFKLRTKSEVRQLMPVEQRREIARKARAARRTTRLPDYDLAEIRARYGERQVGLAAEYGVSQSTISRVQRGLLWAEHV